MTYFDHNELKEVEALSGCFLFVKREALEEVGLLDEAYFMYSEDLDWCRRFHDKGWKVVFNPITCAIHYGGGSSELAPARFAVEQEKAILYYWTKHYGNIYTHLIRVILIMKHVVRILYYFGTYLIRRKQRNKTIERMRRDAVCILSVLGLM